MNLRFRIKGPSVIDNTKIPATPTALFQYIGLDEVNYNCPYARASYVPLSIYDHCLHQLEYILCNKEYKVKQDIKKKVKDTHRELKILLSLVLTRNNNDSYMLLDLFDATQEGINDVAFQQKNDMFAYCGNHYPKANQYLYRDLFVCYVDLRMAEEVIRQAGAVNEKLAENALNMIKALIGMCTTGKLDSKFEVSKEEENKTELVINSNFNKLAQFICEHADDYDYDAVVKRNHNEIKRRTNNKKMTAV